MALLGTKYTVVYEAKNLASGLTGITATIVKPDSSTIGPLALIEYAAPDLAGVYYAEFTPSTADPEGEWIGVIESPNEGNHRRAFRISFELPATGVTGGSIYNPTPP